MTDPKPAMAVAQTASGFNPHMGFELVDWTPGYARTRVTIADMHLNSQGIVHGGVYCSLLDFASGVCGVHPDEKGAAETCMTLSLTTNFVAGVAGGTLYCTARKVGGGYSIFFVEATIEDAEGRTLATSMGTFKYNRKSARPAPGSHAKEDIS